MKKILLICLSAVLFSSCGNQKNVVDNSKSINELTTFLKASEVNRSNDIRQFKEMVLGLKSEMIKSDEKFTTLIGQNKTYTAEVTEGIRNEIESLKTQITSLYSKLSALSSKLEKQPKKKSLKRMVNRPSKAAFKQYKSSTSPSASISKSYTKIAAPAKTVKKEIKMSAPKAEEFPVKTEENNITPPAAEISKPLKAKSGKLQIEDNGATTIEYTKPSNIRTSKLQVEENHSGTIEVVKPVKTKSGKLQIEE